MKKPNPRLRLSGDHNGLHAFRNSQPTSPAEVQRIMLLIRLAYEKLKAGHGSADDFDRLGAALNVGLIRAEAIGQPLVEAFKAAGEAMLACDGRHLKVGRYGFSGTELLAMNAAVDLYSEILSLSSPNQMQWAVEEGCRRLKAGEYITS